MPDTALEACVRRCHNLRCARPIKLFRACVLTIVLILLIAQDLLLKSLAGFAVTTIQPCTDPALGNREFFFLQWTDAAGESLVGNLSTTCGDGARIALQQRDSDFAVYPLPANNSLFARTAMALLDDPLAGAGLRYLWGIGSLGAPLVWWLANMVALFLPRLYTRERGYSYCTCVLVWLLCVVLACSCNLMLILNATVQWQDELGMFAAMLTSLEAAIHFIGAIAIVTCLAAIVLLVSFHAVGASLFRRCRGLCRCLLGVSDQEDALRALILRLTLVSVLICLVAVILKAVQLGALADQYEQEVSGLVQSFRNLTSGWEAGVDWLDRPSLTSDLIGDYFLYQ